MLFELITFALAFLTVYGIGSFLIRASTYRR